MLATGLARVVCERPTCPSTQAEGLCVSRELTAGGRQGAITEGRAVTARAQELLGDRQHLAQPVEGQVSLEEGVLNSPFFWGGGRAHPEVPGPGIETALQQ